jgi:hypothetical protein
VQIGDICIRFATWLQAGHPVLPLMLLNANLRIGTPRGANTLGVQVHALRQQRGQQWMLTLFRYE